jgi:hypothetical protein
MQQKGGRLRTGGGRDGQSAGGASGSARDGRESRTGQRQSHCRGQVTASPGPRVRPAGALPVAAEWQRRSSDRSAPRRQSKASTRLTASSSSACCAVFSLSAVLQEQLQVLSRSALHRTVADRGLRPAGGCFRVEQLPADAVSGDHQRIDRTGQGLRWHRRPQVRQRRARQAGCELRPAEVEAKRAHAPAAVEQQASPIDSASVNGKEAAMPSEFELIRTLFLQADAAGHAWSR